MSNHTSAERDPLVTNMDSLMVHEPRRTVTDDDLPTTIETTDIELYAQDRKNIVGDIDATGIQANGALDAARFSTNTDLVRSSANSSARISPATPDNLPKTDMSSSESSANLSTNICTNTAQVNAKEATHGHKPVVSLFAVHSINRSAGENPEPDAPGGLTPSDSPDAVEAASTAIQSTAPVPMVYPPRRPNIFKTRQKHVRFPVSGLSAVAPRTVGTTAQELEAADGFSVADMQEFQAEIKDRMKMTSERFMNMVRQSALQRRRVEDLGEVFEIEG